MSNQVIGRLIAKDLWLNRFFMGAMICSGLLSLAVASTNRVGFNIGSVTYVTTIVAFGVILAMYGVYTERKEKTALFVLSLPLSIQEYVRAKVFAMLIVYFVPWTILTAGAVVLFLVTPIPDGMIPPTLLLSVFYLAMFCVVVVVALHTNSEAVTTTTIVLTNMSVTLFMFAIFGSPSIGPNSKLDAVVWSDTAVALMAGECVFIGLVLTVPFFTRKRDFS
jgi:ABC-2 type transport system permease protein